MKILGLQKLSLVDWDGHITCTVFAGHCNFACPFCHNSSLVTSEENEINENEVLEYLDKRKNMLDSVCVSGGEPTLYSDLPDFIKKIKDMGYKVKLDTNGTNLNMIKTLVENGLIDYIAMDIKNSIEKYPMTAGRDCDYDTILQSIEYIKTCGIDYEFRTTLIDEFHKEEDIIKISKMLDGAKRYYLQKFVDSGNCIQSGLHEVKKDVSTKYVEHLSNHIGQVQLRGY